MTTVYITLSVLLVSTASLSAIVLLSLKDSVLRASLSYLVSFAVGALFANVFLHLLPELAESSSDIHQGFMLVLVGIVISYMLERFIHWHHCHNLDCRHTETVGTMMLIGDGMHNITDGILIATAFLIDTTLGVTTTIAVVLHEIPQEIGDFAVMLHSGWSKGKALVANFISALTAFIGAGLVIGLHEQFAGIEMVLLPLTAGNFLYIAGSDLVPMLNKETNIKKSVLQLLVMIAGIALMYGVFSGHQHNHVHEETHEEVHNHDH